MGRLPFAAGEDRAADRGVSSHAALYSATCDDTGGSLRN